MISIKGDFIKKWNIFRISFNLVDDDLLVNICLYFKLTELTWDYVFDLLFWN
jgi:hypothetical protein